MSNQRLPAYEAAYTSLCSTGDQFETAPLAPQPFGGLTYTHPQKGQQAVAADPRVLAATGWFHTSDRAVAQELRAQRVNVAPLGILQRVARSSAIRRFVRRQYKQPRLIWGVSGFATIGFPCGIEATALMCFYDHLAATDRLPGLVSDGGAGAGVLGLNGVIAEQRHITTLGFTPLQGLSSMAPRDHMVIWGQTYEEREALVGLFPDFLLCNGGGQGTQREAIAALDQGGYVLVLALKNNADAYAASWQEPPEIAQAIAEGRLLICRQLDDIPNNIDRLHQAASGITYHRRSRRLKAITKRLKR